MKTSRYWIYLALIAFTFTVMAQVSTDPTTVPTSAKEYLVMAIALITPLIVGGVYKVVPKVPKLLLPCLTPVVGVILGLALNWLGKQQLAWLDMAQAGALAVFVREVFTNAVTKQLGQTETTETTVEPKS